ncbi:MAG: hypothetical protein C0483_26450 [Pirellula sp.]|nr:hypothetical protein [Pirellula sp.]
MELLVNNDISDKEIAIAALMTLAVGIVMTPIFGAWIWVALLMATWGLWLSTTKLQELVGR